MGKASGFLEYPRLDAKKRSTEERSLDWQEFKQHMSVADIQTQAARCMNCGVPYCQGGVLLRGMAAGCPLHNLIPEWNDLVYRGQWHEAYRRLSRTSPFPEFTARICPAPCEGSCTEGLHLDPVSICAIEYEIIERAFAEGWVEESTICQPKTGKRICVIGSGPAGLSTAYYLRRSGHAVTVLERAAEPGGLLMYGIPNMKLDKNILRRRLQLLKQMHIDFLCKTSVPENVAADELLRDFDAIVLANGATQARDLSVPGRELDGIHLAVDYLKRATLALEAGQGPDESYGAHNKHVVVIGGGDTGNDCVATAIRQGCQSVLQLEIMAAPAEQRVSERNPWPEWPLKLKTDYGQEEAKAKFGADPRQYLKSTLAALSEDGEKVSRLRIADVSWQKSAAGRMIPQVREASETEVPADLVLIAMGFSGPEDALCQAFGVERDERSAIAASFGNFATSVDKVFAVGDARRGQSLVVWAMEEGKRAAEAVNSYLR